MFNRLARNNKRYLTSIQLELLNEHKKIHNNSISNPEQFWAQAAEKIHWHKKYDKIYSKNVVYNQNNPNADWYAGGQTNMCYNALDRHVFDYNTPDDICLIMDSDVTKTIDKITFQQMHSKVEKLAALLTKNGIQQGDTVIIYMPMIVEAAAAMLACSRIGAIHSVVFGGFAAKELSTRMNHVEAKLILTANGSMEGPRVVDYLKIVDQACDLSKFPKKNVIVYNRLDLVDMVGGQNNLSVSQNYQGFQDMMDEIEKTPTAKQDCVFVDSQHPQHVLYTSGTTGDPKGVVRPTAGYIVALNWSFQKLFGFEWKNQEQIWFCPADIGWIVGHSYGVYGPMINGNTTVMYEGKPVNAKDNHEPFFRILSQHNVEKCFVSPTAMRAVRSFAKKMDDVECEKVKSKYDISNFQHMFIAGEHCEVDTLKWTERAFGCETYDNWWQTEVGWPITCPMLSLTKQDKFNVNFPHPKGSTSIRVPGWDVQILETNEKEHGENGSQIVCKLPLPPGAFCDLWKATERYQNLYFSKFPGYYDSMDSGKLDENNFLTVFSRVDDVINVSGHRLDTGAIEESLCNEPGIFEAAVVGKNDTIKGQIPVAFIIAESQETIDKALERILVEIGRFARIEKVYRTERLPKTRSGKTPRKTLSQMLNGEEIKIPSTIEDETVYDDLKKLVGYPN